MLTINSNDSKWYGQQPDTIEELKEALKNYTLDPIFERYGDFVNRTPIWDNPEYKEKYKGCTLIWGNFLTLSHVFNIVTDDELLIGEIEALVAENKKRPEYLTAKKGRFSQ
jgi:hypothetical protein